MFTRGGLCDDSAFFIARHFGPACDFIYGAKTTLAEPGLCVHDTHGDAGRINQVIGETGEVLFNSRKHALLCTQNLRLSGRARFLLLARTAQNRGFVRIKFLVRQ